MNYLKRIYNYCKQQKWILHIVFWFALFVLGISQDLVVHKNSIVGSAVINLCFQVSQIMMAYYLAYFIIPTFLLKKKIGLFVALFLVGTYIIGALTRILVVHVGEPLVRIPPFEQESILEILTDLKALFFRYAPVAYSGAFVFLFVKYFDDYKRIKEENLTLDKEKVEGELKTLKAQLNPHFLFNTLNNIYSLSVVNSPQTSVSIGKLSEILDHVLYKCNGKFVLLSSEVELLENYIELEKLRYDDRLQISFNSNLENDTQIPPLILLSLVENAFKHGAGEDSGSPSIAVFITNKDSLFTFEISNTISNEYQSENSGLIGLSNIKKQLDLIYEDQYVLKIDENPNQFTVILQINQKDIK